MGEIDKGTAMNSRNSENLAFYKLFMERLLEAERSQYRDAETERKELFDSEIDVVQEFPIWAEIELYASDVRGYASQLAHQGYISSPAKAIVQLQKSNIFNKPNFRIWYLSDRNLYPKLKTLVTTLDYIRLVVIEHISMHQSNETNTRGLTNA